MVNNHWLVVTGTMDFYDSIYFNMERYQLLIGGDWKRLGTMEFGMTFQKQLGMECHHPNWRTPSFFRGVGRKTTNQL